MIIDLKGTRAIVTGSTAGIGFAIAHGLAKSGAEVIINGRSGERVERALSELRQQVPQAALAGVAADLSTAQGVDGFIKEAGKADILVNNLGIFEPKPFGEITDEDWHRFFDTNVMSGIRLSRHYLPRMVQKGWGRLVFISSESALNIPADMIHYGVTKTAQLALSRGLAESAAGSGVTVNAVLPGPTRSEGVADFSARWRSSKACRRSRSRRTSSPSTGRRRSSAGWRRRKKWPTWWSMSARNRRRPQRARRCGSMAAWYARSGKNARTGDSPGCAADRRRRRSGGARVTGAVFRGALRRGGGRSRASAIEGAESVNPSAIAIEKSPLPISSLDETFRGS